MTTSYAFYRGTDDDVIGNPGRVLLADTSYKLPVRIGEIIDLTGGAQTYDALTSTYGWVDVGETDGGITFEHSFNNREWRSDQFGLQRTVPLDYTATVTATALEVGRPELREMLSGGKRGTDNASGEHVTDYQTSPSVLQKHLAILMRDQFGKMHAVVFPKAQWDGNRIREMFARGAPWTIDFGFTAYATGDRLGPDGDHVYRYDLDEA